MPTMIDIFYQEKWNPSELHEQSHTPAPETTPQFPQNSYHASSSIAQLLATHLASLQSNRANSTTNFQTTHSFPTSNGVGQNGLQNFAPSQGIDPRSAYVDNENNLHVGQNGTNMVTVYKYLQ